VKQRAVLPVDDHPIVRPPFARPYGMREYSVGEFRSADNSRDIAESLEAAASC
jgi:hypothetical protein